MNEGQLRAGDVLMKHHYSGPVHALISLAQRLHSAGNVKDEYVHAAIYIGQGRIAESIAGGITATRLMGQGHPYVYDVCRYGDADIAGIAGAVAEGWVAVKRGQDPGYQPAALHEIHRKDYRFGGYAYGGAVTSAIQNVGSQPHYQPGADLWGSDGRPGITSTYCSEFVVKAYHAAGQTAQPRQVPIRINGDRATPKMLLDTLLSEPQWQVMGRIKVN